MSPSPTSSRGFDGGAEEGNVKRQQKRDRDRETKGQTLERKKEKTAQKRSEGTARAKHIHSQLDALAHGREDGKHIDTARLLIRFALERFLFRLGQSEWSRSFVLKGALATALYVPHAFRSTKDGDLQAHGRYTPATMKAVLTKICGIAVDDGLTFKPDEISVTDAGKDRGYAGFEVKIPTRLGVTECPIRLDICFGEVITPPARFVDYPVLLADDPAMGSPTIRIYPLETVIAEKFQIIVHMGMSNTRLKDYFDLVGIGSRCTIDGATLKEAIIGTFQHRGETIPKQPPIGLTEEFYADTRVRKDWKQFLKSLALDKDSNLKLSCESIWDMLRSVAGAAAADAPFEMVWYDEKWNDIEPAPYAKVENQSA